MNETSFRELALLDIFHYGHKQIILWRTQKEDERTQGRRGPFITRTTTENMHLVQRYCKQPAIPVPTLLLSHPQKGPGWHSKAGESQRKIPTCPLCRVLCSKDKCMHGLSQLYKSLTPGQRQPQHLWTHPGSSGNKTVMSTGQKIKGCWKATLLSLPQKVSLAPAIIQWPSSCRELISATPSKRRCCYLFT